MGRAPEGKGPAAGLAESEVRTIGQIGWQGGSGQAKAQGFPDIFIGYFGTSYKGGRNLQVTVHAPDLLGLGELDQHVSLGEFNLSHKTSLWFSRQCES